MLWGKFEVIWVEISSCLLSCTIALYNLQVMILTNWSDPLLSVWIFVNFLKCHTMLQNQAWILWNSMNCIQTLQWNKVYSAKRDARFVYLCKQWSLCNMRSNMAVLFTPTVSGTCIVDIYLIRNVEYRHVLLICNKC